MDVLRSFGDSTSRFTSRAVFNFTNLSPKVQQHLGDVYRKLFMGILILATGVTASIYFALSGGWITSILGLVALVVMQSTPREEHDKRLALFSAFCFLQGLGIGPLVNLALTVDPSTVVLAALSTAVTFGAFSLVAVTARRREYLYLGGALSSMLSVFVILSLANIFIGSTAIFDVLLWGGLAMFVAWIVVDTQVIIEKAAIETNPDALAHATELFIDLVAIFVRILIILLKNSQKKKE